MNNGSYTVKSGDSLSVIASKYGMSVQDLMKANGIDDANKITAGQNINIPFVQESSIDKPEDSFQRTTTAANKNAAKEPWENLETLLKNGKENNSDEAGIKAETGWFGVKTGDYKYTADGELTYGQLKEQLGLSDGILRERNPKLFENIKGNADDTTIPKGTVLNFVEKDLPTKPIEMKDNDGNAISGFSKSLLNNSLVYTVMPGDTQSEIYEKFGSASKELGSYRTSDALHGYAQESLQSGSKVFLDKKFLGLF